MPRNVRNFWLDARIDGRQRLAGGPAAKDGGFDLTIYQREGGEIIEAAEILGRERDGVLTLTIRPNPDDSPFREITVETLR